MLLLSCLFLQKRAYSTVVFSSADKCCSQGNVAIFDQVFNEISALNPLRRLKNVVMDHCQGITSATIWRLLEMPNELNVLRCWHCQGVPAKTRDEVKEIIREENLHVYWEWYAFIEDEDEIAAALAAAELAEQEEDDDDDE